MRGSTLFCGTTSAFAILAGIGASEARAQSQPDQTESAASSGQIGDIIVTAQKREENIQKVPIAISAFSGELLEKSGISSPTGLTNVTPGLNFTKTVAYGAPFIRGVGIAFGTPGDEPPIATYIDGVYNPAFASLALSFNNVERVEVLKGPQGTLFGRNATGGLINIITKRPQQDTAGSVSVGYDNYQTLQASAYVTGGLSSSVSADVAVFLQEQGKGYSVNPQINRRTGREDVASIRAKLLIDVAPGAEVLVAASYTDAFLGLGNARVPVRGTLPLAAIVGGQFSYDPRTAYSPYEGQSKLKQFVGSIQADVDIGGASIRSISSYRRTRYLNEFNAAATSLDNVAPITLDYYAQEHDPIALTQELQLISDKGGAIDWVAGAYFQYSEAGYKPFFFGFARGQVAAGAVTKQTTTAAAVFGQATYHMDNGLSFTAGLRYNYEKKKYVAAGIGGFTGLGVDASKHWTDPSWRLAVDYQASSSTMLYASYNRGFKSGVFSSNALSSTPVDPEKLDAYEIGIKTDLLDRHLRLNVSSYYYKFKDLQVFVVAPGGAGTILANAARARIYGVEIDAKAVVNKYLSFTAGLALSNPEYASFPNAQIYTPALGGNPLAPTGGNLVGTADATGQQLERAPKRTLNIATDLSLPLDNGGEIAANINLYHNSGFPWDPVGRIRERGYEVLNASLTWTLPNDKYSITIFSNNITNTLYHSDITESDFVDAGAYSPPRTIGARLKVNF